MCRFDDHALDDGARHIERGEGPSELIDVLAIGWWEDAVLYAVLGVFFAYWWYLRLMAVF